jgi:hypothetical protein
MQVPTHKPVSPHSTSPGLEEEVLVSYGYLYGICCSSTQEPSICESPASLYEIPKHSGPLHPQSTPAAPPTEKAFASVLLLDHVHTMMLLIKFE